MEKSPRQQKAELLKQLQAGKMNEAEFKPAAKENNPDYIDWEKFESWVKSSHPEGAYMAIKDVHHCERDVSKISGDTHFLLWLFTLTPDKFSEALKAAFCVDCDNPTKNESLAA